MARAIDVEFLQLDVDLHSTPRFLAFASALRPHVTDLESGAWVSVAYLALIRTWERFLRHQSDGRPADIPPDVLEEWAGWRGIRGRYADAFLQHWTERDADGLVLRGWHARYGRIAQKRAQDAARKRLTRRSAGSRGEDHPDADEDNGGNVHRTSDGHPPDIQPDVRAPLHRTSAGIPPKNDTRVKSKEELLTPSPGGEGAPSSSERPDTPPCFDAPFVLDEDDVVPDAAPVPAVPGPAVSARATPRQAAPRKREAAKYPHFHAETRNALLEIWEEEVRPLKSGEPGRLFATFGPFFRLPESERPESQPRDAEVLAAVREILQARAKGGRATANLAQPEYCAERVRATVEILRTSTTPLDRVDRIDRLLGIPGGPRQFAR
ncbi:hypothetical protein [Gemmatimonas sp.]